MGMMQIGFSQPEFLPLPAMRASGPDDDVKTLVTPDAETVSDEEVSSDAPEDGEDKVSPPGN